MHNEFKLDHNDEEATKKHLLYVKAVGDHNTRTR